MDRFLDNPVGNRVAAFVVGALLILTTLCAIIGIPYLLAWLFLVPHASPLAPIFP